MPHAFIHAVPPLFWFMGYFQGSCQRNPPRNRFNCWTLWGEKMLIGYLAVVFSHAHYVKSVSLWCVVWSTISNVTQEIKCNLSCVRKEMIIPPHHAWNAPQIPSLKSLLEWQWMPCQASVPLRLMSQPMTSLQIRYWKTFLKDPLCLFCSFPKVINPASPADCYNKGSSHALWPCSVKR